MRLAIIAFLLGILICQQLTALPNIQWVWLLLAMIVGLGIIVLYARSMRFFIVCVICIILGFLWMFWNAQAILAQQLPKEIEGQKITIQGRIVSIPTQNKFNTQFDLHASHFVYQDQFYPFHSKVRLKWYVKDNQILSVAPDQLWQFTVKLKRPHGTVNFTGFDYAKYLFSQRIIAIGNINRTEKPIWLDSSRDYHPQTIRYQLIQHIKNLVIDLPNAGIILAMGLGERSLISSQQWNLFRQTGTSHLVAISGLHVSSIALVTFFISRRLWSHLGNVALWLPSIYFATIVTLLAVSFYVFLAGFSISAQRAFMMILGFLMPNLLDRHLSVSHRISLALAFVLLYDPLSTLSAGFWLSFILVSTLVYFSQFIHLSPIRRKWYQASGIHLRTWFVQLILLQAILSLVAFPLSYYFFQTPVILSPILCNLLLIPLTSFIILPAIFFSILLSIFSTWLALPVFYFISDLLVRLFKTVHFIQGIEQPYSSLLHTLATNLNLFTISLTLFSLFTLFAPRGFHIRWLGLIGLLPLFFTISTPKTIQHGEFAFTVLDVGQSLATVIRTQNHQLMYDAASQWMSKSVIVPHLKTQQFRHLDLLIASHGDSDHIGGVNVIVQNIPIQQILTGATEIGRIQDFLKVPLQQQVPIALCKAGQQWQWDGVYFEILHPTRNYRNRNDRSCVLKITGKNHSMLLAGDISSQVELSLLSKNLQADVLIAPHHGSKTSSSTPFIRVVNPKVVIFSTRYLNHFRHPHPDIVRRYQRFNIQTLNTAETGAIHFDPNSHDFLKPILAREQRRQIWHY
ncbi:DNA internalization-related competence protein ComEC/Rec2 [Candidatus Albibeggiatoa sp. nov. NOAA]|uniref:DNA internalization-related competence protein ComEC/Rec2 n=1 Tax=Candidatus Albibeggiatoa sp. nov. NOAA TaxID=3162724 RepID=UPI0032FD68F0|nr:DNA internalization-related competence protein ComEC/Rec2 [Thiotrichaceae bacterium]